MAPARPALSAATFVALCAVVALIASWVYSRFQLEEEYRISENRRLHTLSALSSATLSSKKGYFPGFS